jgi:hypothetical protein
MGNFMSMFGPLTFFLGSQTKTKEIENLSEPSSVISSLWKSFIPDLVTTYLESRMELSTAVVEDGDNFNGKMNMMLINT